MKKKSFTLIFSVLVLAVLSFPAFVNAACKDQAKTCIQQTKTFKAYTRLVKMSCKIDRYDEHKTPLECKTAVDDWVAEYGNLNAACANVATSCGPPADDDLPPGDDF